jgi:hypothetical protein
MPPGGRSWQLAWEALAVWAQARPRASVGRLALHRRARKYRRAARLGCNGAQWSPGVRQQQPRALLEGTGLQSRPTTDESTETPTTDAHVCAGGPIFHLPPGLGLARGSWPGSGLALAPGWPWSGGLGHPGPAQLVLARYPGHSPSAARGAGRVARPCSCFVCVCISKRLMDSVPTLRQACCATPGTAQRRRHEHLPVLLALPPHVYTAHQAAWCCFLLLAL